MNNVDTGIISNKNKENYELIDVMKFICAIMVVVIHSGVSNDTNSTVQWYILQIALRLAVPFFFIASGFLFGKKYLKNKANLKQISKKQIKRLLIPYIFWSIVNIPFIMHSLQFDGNVCVYILRIIRLLIFNGYHLWFVLALIVAIFIEYIFLKKNKIKIAIILSIMLYCIALLGNSYYFLIEGTPFQNIMDIIIKVFSIVRNGIFVGFPLFTVGICIAFYEKKICNINNKIVYILLVFFILTQAIEATFIRGKNYMDDYSTFISTIFVSTILLIICIKNKDVKFKRIDTKRLRSLSTGFYYMHFSIEKYMLILVPTLSNWSILVITILILIITNYILLKINNKYINLLIK